MKLGVVGTGKMGSALIDGIYFTNAHEIYISAYNRTKEKISALSKKYPKLSGCEKIEAVIEKSDVLVFAVPFSFIRRLPHSAIVALREMEPLTLALCGYAPIKILEKYLPSKVAKAYPNINWAVGAGVTIVNFGARFKAVDKETILTFLSRLGAVHEAPEDQFRALSNLMSCGPALWVKLIDLFIEANVKRYAINQELGFELTQKTIEGTFRLMKEKHYSTEQVIEAVAGPGGTTEVGLNCFEQSLPNIFADTVARINSRDKERIQRLERD